MAAMAAAGMGDQPAADPYQGAYEGYGGAPSQWGNPKAAEKKKPPKRDFLDGMFTYVNYDLLVSKTFYFFFFAAFGSLFPLIAVYFKQIGMNPTQTGILIGFRPFVEFFSAPFWGSLADKWRKGKQVMLVSLFCWILFTLALAFVKPEPSNCIAHNSSHVILVPPWQDMDKLGGNIEMDIPDEEEQDAESVRYRIRHMKDVLPHPKILQYGISPLPLDHMQIANMNEEDVEGLVSPPFSSVVYRSSDITKVFFILLILILIGEFFSAPAIALADSATLGYLQDDVENYGRQRMFGSLGWGLSMFFVGVALDHANIFYDHPCGYKQKVERNYTVCFAVFTVLMSCAFIAATQFRFFYDGFAKEAFSLKDIKKLGQKVVGKVQNKMDESRGWGKQQFEGEADPNGDVYRGDGLRDEQRQQAQMEQQQRLEIRLQSQEGDTAKPDMVSDSMKAHLQDQHDVVTKPSPFIPRGKPGQSGTMPDWLTVIKMFGTIKYGSLLYLTWFMGFGVGLVFTFLFWHLQDLTGTPTLFGIASVINHVSEIIAYFFSKKLINYVGHIRVLYIGLLGNVARFIYISYLRNPWWVLPFEFLQGLTHAAVWAALCSYITQATPANLRSTAQGVLQGIHHGLGRGCGAVIGGILIYYFGTENVFRGYGIACVIVLVIYFAVQYFYIDKLPPDDKDALKEPGQFLEETAHLAPCGVPMSISRNLSSSKLDEMGREGQAYGATTNGYLDPGNAGNRGVPHAGYDQGGSARDDYSYSLPANIGNRMQMQNGQATQQHEAQDEYTNVPQGYDQGQSYGGQQEPQYVQQQPAQQQQPVQQHPYQQQQQPQPQQQQQGGYDPRHDPNYGY